MHDTMCVAWRVVLGLATASASIAQAQWPATGTVYQRTVRERWMNARQSPAFTTWQESESVVHLDSTTGTRASTSLHFSRQRRNAPPAGAIVLSAGGRGQVIIDSVTGPASGLLWDLVPAIHPARFVAGTRWSDTVDWTSNQDNVVATLRGRRRSTLLREVVVEGTHLWVVRDTLRGTYRELRTQRERTLRADVTILRETQGLLTGEYLVDPVSQTIRDRADTASFWGTATLRYPDSRVFTTTTSFEQTRRIRSFGAAEYDSVTAEARRRAPRFSMFIFPKDSLEKRLRAGDLPLRDSLLLELDRSRDVAKRSRLQGLLESWGRGRSGPFADTLRHHFLLAGDTGGVVRRMFDPADVTLTPERLALILPFVRDPGVAFAWGVPAGEFYENVEQRLGEYPPSVHRSPYHQVCTPEACDALAALRHAEVDPRLRHVGLMTAFAADPVRWIDSVQSDSALGRMRFLLDGVGADWPASSHPRMPPTGASWRAWVEWMNGAAVPDSVTAAGPVVPRMRFEESHSNAASFYGLLSGRNLDAEWREGAGRASSALERFIFETMLAHRDGWRPDADSAAQWLMDGTAIGHARGVLGAEQIMRNAPGADSATATALIDRVLAHAIDGEEPWPLLGEGSEPRPIGTLLDNATRSDKGLAGQEPQTIYVKTPIVTPELVARWGNRVTWVTDPKWVLREEDYPAAVVTIHELASRGRFATIGADIFSARKDREGINAGEGGNRYLLVRTPRGWRLIDLSGWVV